MAKKSEDTLDTGVKFGKASLGHPNTSIGITIPWDGKASEDRLLGRMRHFLCGSQLKIDIRKGKAASDDVPGQQELPGMTTKVITGIAEVGGFSVTPNAIKATLKFKSEDMKPGASALEDIAQRNGRLIANRTGDAGESEEDVDEADEEKEE